MRPNPRLLHGSSILFALPVATALVACGGATGDPRGGAPGPALGPQSGETQRFAVDAIRYPEKPADFAVDVNGDGLRENHFATVLGVFQVNQNDPGEHVGRLLASGRLAPTVEITSDDPSLQNASNVRLRIAEGKLEAIVQGTLTKGAFASPRAFKTSAPLTGEVRVPILTDSDPIVLPIVGLEVRLDVQEDGTLAGSIHGAVRKADLESRVLPEVHRAFNEMVAAHPELHTSATRYLDRDADGKVSFDEFKSSPLVQSFLKMDVQLYDANGAWAPNAKNTTPDAMSLGFGFHAKPSSSAVVAR
jgi:hypothetical protein